MVTTGDSRERRTSGLRNEAEGGRKARNVTPLKGTLKGALLAYKDRGPVTTATDQATRLGLDRIMC